MTTIKKYFQIITLFLCFNASGQFNITLSEKGDSSIYAISVDDTLAYISFVDPNVIRVGIEWFSGNTEENEILRSHLVMSYRIKNNTLVLRQTFGKRYLNPVVEYSDVAQYEKDKLIILFEGKESYNTDSSINMESFLNIFDSLFVEIGDSNYLADLNTTIFRVAALKPAKKQFTVRIHDNQEWVDFKTTVRPKKNTTGIFIRFDLLESQVHSANVQDYLQQYLPGEAVLSGKKYQVKYEFINWPYYWETGKISYSEKIPAL